MPSPPAAVSSSHQRSPRRDGGGVGGVDPDRRVGRGNHLRVHGDEPVSDVQMPGVRAALVRRTFGREQLERRDADAVETVGGPAVSPVRRDERLRVAPAGSRVRASRSPRSRPVSAARLERGNRRRAGRRAPRPPRRRTGGATGPRPWRSRATARRPGGASSSRARRTDRPAPQRARSRASSSSVRSGVKNGRPVLVQIAPVPSPGAPNLGPSSVQRRDRPAQRPGSPCASPRTPPGAHRPRDRRRTPAPGARAGPARSTWPPGSSSAAGRSATAGRWRTGSSPRARQRRSPRARSSAGCTSVSTTRRPVTSARSRTSGSRRPGAAPSPAASGLTGNGLAGS